MSSPRKYAQLQDKHVFIIGGSSGIGYAVAEASIEAGAIVTITSSSSDKLPTVVSKLRSQYPEFARRIHGVVASLAEPSEQEANLDQAFKHATAAAGQIHHVVLTAANGLKLGPLSESSYADILKSSEMRGPLQLLVGKVAPRYLINSRESSITLTTGSGGDRPRKGWAVAAYLCGGIEGITRGLAVDLAPIRVNAVKPAEVSTPMWAALPDGEREQMFAVIKSQTLTGEVAEVEDVAEAYLWLLKDRNATGTLAGTDGGLLLAGF